MIAIHQGQSLVSLRNPATAGHDTDNVRLVCLEVETSLRGIALHYFPAQLVLETGDALYVGIGPSFST
jgi:hypothetical protein